MNELGFLLVAALLAASAVAPGGGRSLDEAAGTKATPADNGAGGGFGIPGWGGGGGGFPGIPGGGGWGNVGGGWGAGYGGPAGGYAGGGVVRTSVVCHEKGPCYKKRLTCPAKCFSSYSRSGKNYGAGGGGGGCTIDCSKRCAAYC